MPKFTFHVDFGQGPQKVEMDGPDRDQARARLDFELARDTGRVRGIPGEAGKGHMAPENVVEPDLTNELGMGHIFSGGPKGQAAFRATAGALVPGTPETWGERYDQAMAQNRAVRARTAQEYPALAPVAREASALITGMAAMPGGTSFGANVGGGAILGGLDAFNRPESLEQSLREGGPGAAVGAVGSALTHGLFSTIGRGIRAAGAGGKAGAEQAAKSIPEFQALGLTPTLGQATEAAAPNALEKLMGSNLMTAGPIRKKIRSQSKQIQDSMIPKNTLDPDQAGNLAKREIQEWTEAFKTQGGQLFENIPIPRSARVRPRTTLAALNKMLKPASTAKRTTTNLQSPFLQEIRDDMLYDLSKNKGVMSYEGLRGIRSKIGDRITDQTLAGGNIGMKELKGVYRALSQDLERMARVQGPDAYRQMRRANQFYRAGHNRIAEALEPINNRVFADSAYDALTRGDIQSIYRLKRSMKPGVWDNKIAPSIAERMGLTSAGRQGAEGNIFSTDVFLTEWRRLNRLANDNRRLKAIFPTELYNDLNAVAKVAEHMKLSAKDFANPSGTFGAMGNAATVLSILASIPAAVMGNVAPMAGIAGVGVTGNIGARLMTNPKFVRWIVEADKLPRSKMPAHISKLSALATNEFAPFLTEYQDQLQRNFKLQDRLPQGGQ